MEEERQKPDDENGASVPKSIPTPMLSISPYQYIYMYVYVCIYVTKASKHMNFLGV